MLNIIILEKLLKYLYFFLHIMMDSYITYKLFHLRGPFQVTLF